MRPRLRRSRLSTQHEKHQGHPFDCPSWPSAAVPSEPSSCVRNIVRYWCDTAARYPYEYLCRGFILVQGVSTRRAAKHIVSSLTSAKSEEELKLALDA